MSASPNLQLPYLDANQNQKTVTHNAALRMLDALVSIGVQSSTLQAPPAAPGDGQRWVVASGATGLWSGKDLNIAAWQDGAWVFYAPAPGFLVFDIAQGTLVYWLGGAWHGLAGLLALLAVKAIGIGTAADPANPVSATLNAALFNALGTAAGGTGDLRLKLNKAAVGNTASFLFQDGFSGRAEIGLAGDDDFHFKVSADGSTFHDGIVIDAATGGVMFGAPARLACVPVAALPAGSAGAMAFAADGRKVGEAVGAGTGVVVAWSGGAWRRLADDAAVTA